MFANEIKNQDFYLETILIYRSHSKDINSQHYYMKIKDREVEYHYEYKGFPFHANKKVSNKYRLSNTQYKEMIEQIKSNSIDRNVTEVKKDNYTGVSADLLLTLKLNGKTIQSHIKGMTSSFRHKDKVLDNKSYVDNIYSLISDLKK